MTQPVTQDDLLAAVEGTLSEDRVEDVRAFLRANPQTARRLHAMAQDRTDLSRIAGINAAQSPPPGMVESALNAAEQGGARETSRDDRHQRARLGRFGWPAKVAASITLVVLGGWIAWLLGIGPFAEPDTPNAPDSVPRVTLAPDRGEFSLPEDPQSATPEPTSAPKVAESFEALERDLQRELSKLNALPKPATRTAEKRSASSDDVIAEILGDDSSGRSQSPSALFDTALAETGLSTDELNRALLDGRVTLRVRTTEADQAVEEVLSFDGAQGPGGVVLTVLDETPSLLGGPVSDNAKARNSGDGATAPDGEEPRPPADDPVNGTPARATMDISFTLPVGIAESESLVEFKRISEATLRHASGAEIAVAEEDASGEKPPAFDLNRMFWWKHNPGAWTPRKTVRFTVDIESQAPADAPDGE